MIGLWLAIQGAYGGCVALPEPPELPPDAPAAAAAAGVVTVDVRAATGAGTPVSRIPVKVESEGGTEEAVTDQHGRAVLRVPPAQLVWVWVDGDATVLEEPAADTVVAVEHAVGSPPRTPAPGSATLDTPILLTYERTACSGDCPVFEVSLTKEGELTWEGKAEVRKEGVREARLDTDAMNAVKSELACFVDMPVYTAHGSTEFGRTTLQFRYGDASYRWSWYEGDPRAPSDALAEARRQLERALGIHRWH